MPISTACLTPEQKIVFGMRNVLQNRVVECVLLSYLDSFKGYKVESCLKKKYIPSIYPR